MRRLGSRTLMLRGLVQGYLFQGVAIWASRVVAVVKFLVVSLTAFPRAKSNLGIKRVPCFCFKGAEKGKLNQ